jgi:hypothetical protein
VTRIIIDLTFHVVATLLFSVWIFIETKNPTYIGIFILGGIFIDLDHFIDYYKYYKNGFNLKDFFDCNYLASGKVYLLLHSWELSIILFSVSAIIGSHGLFLFALSMSIHLLIDNLQRRNPLFYFIFYRFAKQFQMDLLLPESPHNLKRRFK